MFIHVYNVNIKTRFFFSKIITTTPAPFLPLYRATLYITNIIIFLSDNRWYYQSTEMRKLGFMILKMIKNFKI